MQPRTITSRSNRPGQQLPVTAQASLVLILPFEPTMIPKKELETSLQAAAGQAEQELKVKLGRQVALPVIWQMVQAIKELNYSTHKRSLILLASADMADSIYLDEPLDQR